MEENKVQNLVEQAQNGNQNAFGQIYDLYSARIFNFLIFRVRHQETAEDLVHTVFLKAWNNLKTYRRGKAKFSTWLFQIANYTLIDHWRTKKDTVEIDKIENLFDYALEPQKYESYEYLWECINELPDEQKTIIDLRFKQDIGIEEAAYILNKSRVGIRVLQHRALRNLRKNLERKGYI